jgi:3-deoxy-D-manno-octulosonate 8-phosphate phosphatase (KDO 8-P phosphatase)
MKDVRLIIFDVDGTLTDGGMYFGPQGEEFKRFCACDGLGFGLARCAGLRIAIVSGRDSESVRARMRVLHVDDVLLAVDDKHAAIVGLKTKYDLTDSQVAFVGDDLNDIPAFEAVGVRITVANGVEKLKLQADYITKAAGGDGAAREVIEAVLTAQGRYDEVVDAFLANLTKGRNGNDQPVVVA